jgi:outer membrane protein TolC
LSRGAGRARALPAALLLAAAAGVSAQPPEPVAFAEAVRLASTQATTVLVAADEIRRSEALLTEVRAASLPFLGGTATYTRLDSARGPAAAPLVARDALNTSATLQLPLVAPSRWVSWSHASEQVGVARAGEADVRRGAALTAARAYLTILAQKRVIEVSRSAREIARARFEFARARRAGGVGTAVEELRAEQQVATAEVQLAGGEVGLVRAQEALGIVTGSPGPLDAVEEPAFQPAAEPEAIAAAESRRLDVQAARARSTAAHNVARDTWVEWLPTLLANAQVFYNDPAATTTPRTGWLVQFVLSVPIFEGGLRLGLQEERNALADEARLGLEGVLKQVRSEVRLGLDEVRRREGALAQARLAADRAGSVLALTIQAYRAGAANDLDVSTSQQQARDADLAAVIAEDAVRQARLDLVTALGQFP